MTTDTTRLFAMLDDLEASLRDTDRILDRIIAARDQRGAMLRDISAALGTPRNDRCAARVLEDIDRYESDGYDRQRDDRGTEEDEPFDYDLTGGDPR